MITYVANPKVRIETIIWRVTKARGGKIECPYMDDHGRR